MQRVGARVSFSHADGAAYGEVAEPRSLEVLTKVFGALRNLGFREGEVRRVLSELRGREELRGADGGRWLRAALQRLTEPATRSPSTFVRARKLQAE